MTDAKTSPLEQIIVPPVRDLGDGFSVRRALPNVKRRTIGPYVFLDRMGPVRFRPGEGIDVRPHPHIGLATVTYLLEGEILHRDSLGTTQPIRPGEVNWMTAGRGIVHSERTAAELRAEGPALSGVQIWVALPDDQEETDPAFHHYGADALPVISGLGLAGKLIAGSLGGATSPVRTASPMVCADIEMEAGARWTVPDDFPERGIFVLSGEIAIIGADEAIATNELAVLSRGGEVKVRATGPARLLLIGGEPVGPRTIYWNFVSSRPERIEQAKADWREGRFAGVEGEPDVIPLPPDPPSNVRIK